MSSVEHFLNRSYPRFASTTTTTTPQFLNPDHEPQFSNQIDATGRDGG